MSATTCFLHWNPHSPYMTPGELVDVCIPLAGVKASPAAIARAVSRHRRGKLDLDGWPNCAPGANDARMATESPQGEKA